MNKSDFVKELAQEMGVTNKQADAFIDAYHGLLKKTLAKGDQVTFIGFGTYEVRNRGAREARNPQTGETIQVKAARLPAFRAGRGLKDAVNQG
jgi:DNA-binding protein HU-beta